MRARRSSTPCQPEVIRSTSSARSSTRAWRSARSVALDPLQPPDHLVREPAHLGELARDRQRLGRGRRPGRPRRPSPAATPRGRRRPRRAPRPGCGRAPAPPRRRPAACRLLAAASAGRSRARSTASVVHGGKGTVAGRMETARARLRAAARADRPAPGRAARRVAAARLRAGDRRGAAPAVLGAAGGARRTSSSSSTTRGSSRRGSGCTGRAAGEAEVLLLEPLGDGVWEALARPTRRLRRRAAARPGGAARAARRGPLAAPARRRAGGRDAAAAVHHRAARRSRALPDASTRGRTGSAAAPTAGLHFTPELLGALDVERVTLHVGLDTFRPLADGDAGEHQLHGERYAVAAAAWERITAPSACSPSARRRCACSRRSRAARRSQGRTSLFVTPGFEFRRVDALLDELPPPALDAAGARDGVRGRRGDAASCTGSRSRSGTASTRSATRC